MSRLNRTRVLLALAVCVAVAAMASSSVMASSSMRGHMAPASAGSRPQGETAPGKEKARAENTSPAPTSSNRGLFGWRAAYENARSSAGKVWDSAKKWGKESIEKAGEGAGKLMDKVGDGAKAAAKSREKLKPDKPQIKAAAETPQHVWLTIADILGGLVSQSFTQVIQMNVRTFEKLYKKAGGALAPDSSGVKRNPKVPVVGEDATDSAAGGSDAERVKVPGVWERMSQIMKGDFEAAAGGVADDVVSAVRSASSKAVRVAGLAREADAANKRLVKSVVTKKNEPALMEVEEQVRTGKVKCTWFKSGVAIHPPQFKRDHKGTWHSNSNKIIGGGPLFSMYAARGWNKEGEGATMNCFSGSVSTHLSQRASLTSKYLFQCFNEKDEEVPVPATCKPEGEVKTHILGTVGHSTESLGWGCLGFTTLNGGAILEARGHIGSTGKPERVISKAMHVESGYEKQTTYSVGGEFGADKDGPNGKLSFGVEKSIVEKDTKGAYKPKDFEAVTSPGLDSLKSKVIDVSVELNGQAWIKGNGRTVIQALSAINAVGVAFRGSSQCGGTIVRQQDSDVYQYKLGDELQGQSIVDGFRVYLTGHSKPVERRN